MRVTSTAAQTGNLSPKRGGGGVFRAGTVRKTPNLAENTSTRPARQGRRPGVASSTLKIRRHPSMANPTLIAARSDLEGNVSRKPFIYLAFLGYSEISEMGLTVH